MSSYYILIVGGNLIKPMLCFQTLKTLESQKLFDIFNRYRTETLTSNDLRLQTNIVGNLI